MEISENLKLFFQTIYNLVVVENYEEAKNIINNSMYKNYHQCKNILYIIRKIEYLDKVVNYNIKDTAVEETYNLWANFFKNVRENNFTRAYLIICEINNKFNRKNDNYDINLYKLLIEQLLNKIHEKNSKYNKVGVINEKILAILKKNYAINYSDLKSIKILLNEKINFLEENNINCYFDKNTYYLIEVIEQLLNEKSLSINLFSKIEINGNNLEQFYVSLENGDYPTVYSLIKNKEVYDNILENSDNIYPILLIKILNYFHTITKSKKIIRFYQQLDGNEEDKYQILTNLIVNNEYEEAMKYYLENKFETNLIGDLLLLSKTKK
jgi:hypothetical protein